MSLRTILPALALFATTIGMAQSGDALYFQAASPMDASNLKFVIQAMVDIDPMATVGYSDDMTIIQVRRNPSVSEAQVREAIASAGVTLQPGLIDPASLTPAPDPNAEPVFIVTGDTEADQARYRSAVEVWNSNHPEAPIAAPVHLTNE
jgi:hypothetical protein